MSRSGVRVDIRNVDIETIRVLDGKAKELHLSRTQMANLILDNAAKEYREQRAALVLQNKFDDVVSTLNTLINRSNENEQEIVNVIKGYAEIERDKIFELSGLLKRVEAILSGDQSSKIVAKDFGDEDEKAF